MKSRRSRVRAPKRPWRRSDTRIHSCKIPPDLAVPTDKFGPRGDVSEQAQSGLLPLIGHTAVGPVLFHQQLSDQVTVAPPRSPNQEFAVVDPFHPLAEATDVESDLAPHSNAGARNPNQITD